MIIIKEQYGYKNPKSIKYDLSGYTTIEPHKKLFKQKKSDGCCYEITKNNKGLNIEASYFIGIDWFIENELPIYIQPKLNKDESEVNYVRMLFDALQEPENFNHLDYLCEINFDRPSIKIDQTKDLLSPLLVIQYLQLLRRIVQKGLKKSYYPVVKNLNARVKGKILVNATIKNNHVKNKMLYSYCKYDEFGLNTIENKVLKKALLFSQKAIQNINGINPEQLQGLFNYIQPAFYSVDEEVDIEELKTIKPNPLYKEYQQALKLAKFILKRYGYTISTVHPIEIQTPPFWIDMSKLFELYVFAKLKELFPLNGEVEYHVKTNRQELDFIINSKDKKYQMVVDAKYKPQYKESNINKEDIRQVSGYARMKSVYKELEKDDHQTIDCLIIYSDQKANRKNFVNDNFDFVPESSYVRFYKIGIELPII
jgi:5-methylcytosine-specific restriction enzyme subunit McrC